MTLNRPYIAIFDAKKTPYRSWVMARAKRHFIPGYIWHILIRLYLNDTKQVISNNPAIAGLEVAQGKRLKARI